MPAATRRLILSIVRVILARERLRLAQRARAPYLIALLVALIVVPYVGEAEPMGSSGSPYLDRGIMFKIEGRYEEAISQFLELLQQDPNSSDGHYQLGLVYGYTGMFDESVDELERALTLDGTRLDIRVDLALTYAMLGMNDEAKREFEEVLRRDPENEKALKNIVFFSDPA